MFGHTVIHKGSEMGNTPKFKSELLISHQGIKGEKANEVKKNGLFKVLLYLIIRLLSATLSSMS